MIPLSFTLIVRGDMMADIEPIDQPDGTLTINNKKENGRLECVEGTSNYESIIGKVLDTPDDVYTFYNDFAFLHGFSHILMNIQK